MQWYTKALWETGTSSTIPLLLLQGEWWEPETWHSPVEFNWSETGISPLIQYTHKPHHSQPHCNTTHYNTAQQTLHYSISKGKRLIWVTGVVEVAWAEWGHKWVAITCTIARDGTTRLWEDGGGCSQTTNTIFHQCWLTMPAMIQYMELHTCWSHLLK